MVYFLIKDAIFCQILDQIAAAGIKSGKLKTEEDTDLCSSITNDELADKTNTFLVESLLHIRQTCSSPSLLQAVKVFLGMECAYLLQQKKHDEQSLDVKEEVEGVKNDLLMRKDPLSLLLKHNLTSSSSNSGFTAYVQDTLVGFTFQVQQIEALFCTAGDDIGSKEFPDPSEAAVSYILSLSQKLTASMLEPHHLFHHLLLNGFQNSNEHHNETSSIDSTSLHSTCDGTNHGVNQRKQLAGPLQRLCILRMLLARAHQVRREREQLLTEAAFPAGSKHSGQTLYPLKKDLCFHDRDMLIPVRHINDMLHAFYAVSQEGGSGSNSAFTNGAFQLLRLCHQYLELNVTDKRKSVSASKLIASVIVSPAVTPIIRDEPSQVSPHAKSGEQGSMSVQEKMKKLHPTLRERRLKNERVELIQQASTAYFYDHVVRSSSSSPHRQSSPQRPQGSIRPLYEEMFDMETFERYVEEGVGVPSGVNLSEHHRQQQSSSSIRSMLGDVSVGIDMLVMLFSGAITGYFLGALRGASEKVKLLYMIVGMSIMLFVDGFLLMARMHHDDAKKTRDKRRRQKFWSKKQPLAFQNEEVKKKQ